MAITSDVQARYPAPCYEPFTTPGWLAGVTRRLEFATTAIVLPYRHPLAIGRQVANVDQLSGGRPLCGVGVGWAQQEFEVLGVPFRRCGARTDDYLVAIKTLWTRNVASFQGCYVAFQGVHTAPRPVRTPHPPIWVGGTCGGQYTLPVWRDQLPCAAPALSWCGAHVPSAVEGNHVSELIETDVLIIGCGVAGGTVALRLADAGLPVMVVTRASDPHDTNTHLAQGGIIYQGKDDSSELLVADILRAGAGHSNQQAATILATEGPGLVEDILLKRLDVAFDRLPGGALSLALEGGHSVPRIVHAADATGKAIGEALVRALQAHPKVTLLAGHTAIDLLTPAHHSLNRLDIYAPLTCVGAYLYDQASGQVKRCIARHTVLATGGLGQIFLRTTNPVGARGDGVAIAYRAGARVINMEFVQFHPTTFAHPNAPHFLITEAVRGEGGRLVHANGEPFMTKYDPEWRDLAPRDVVARSIYHEMLAKDVPNVYLDLRSYIPEHRIREHFPTIYAECLKYGIDITKDLVPVVPGAHYACGGVWVDMWGCTTFGGLYAVGEVACTGLQGANRLASTSLLEGLVWGDRLARYLQAHWHDLPRFDSARIPPWHDAMSQGPPDPALIQQDMSVIKHLMWNYVGLVRTTPRLERALRELRHLETEIERFYRATALTDGVIGLRNAVRTAVIVAMAAWENKTSVGCHYRE